MTTEQVCDRVAPAAAAPSFPPGHPCAEAGPEPTEPAPEIPDACEQKNSHGQQFRGEQKSAEHDVEHFEADQ